MQLPLKRLNSGPRILVVEDDEGQALLTVRALKKHGFDVLRVANGTDCMNTLQAGGDFVVLLDLGLPDIPGMEVLEKIAKKSAEMPVILVTGVDDLKIAVEAIHKGAWDYVVKRVDLSHLEELPHVIRRNQDRQRMVQERSLFLSMLSHDIKNPVQVILSYADIIREDGNLTEDSLHFLDRIKHNAENILRLVGDFVEVRKIEAGKLVINRQPVSFKTMLNELVGGQRALASTKNIRVDFETLGEPPQIEVDRHYVERAFTNLIGNAIKYTPEGGKVTVTLAEEEGGVRVSISDTGQGIPADELPYIFDKFRRARGHGAVEGSGLGLYIVKAIIEAHEGHIEVESQPAKGSIFTIRFPAVAGSAAKPAGLAANQ